VRWSWTELWYGESRVSSWSRRHVQNKKIFPLRFFPLSRVSLNWSFSRQTLLCCYNSVFLPSTILFAAWSCPSNSISHSPSPMRPPQAGFGQWTRPQRRPQAWTCPGCSVKPPSSSRRTFTNHARINIGSRTRQRRVLWAAGTASVATVGGFFFQDDIKHVWQATERSSRVVSTLGICINEFVTPTIRCCL
jgi:hypothetical protein